jgi:hypothetical protein
MEGENYLIKLVNMRDSSKMEKRRVEEYLNGKTEKGFKDIMIMI